MSKLLNLVHGVEDSRQTPLEERDVIVRIVGGAVLWRYGLAEMEHCGAAGPRRVVRDVRVIRHRAGLKTVFGAPQRSQSTNQQATR